MRIQTNGVEYTGWTEAQVILHLDKLSNGFNFVATSEEGGQMPFRGGETCTITVDGELVLTGHIEIVNVDGDKASHSISISGRDRTGDVVDSKIGSLSDIRPPISLKKIIEIVLIHIGSPIKVFSECLILPFQTSEDLAAAEFGQDVWDFIESLARKRQVLLSSNAFGNILITRASGKAINATLQNRIKDNANNVMSYSVSYDTTGVYNIYRASGQQNPIAINGTESRSNYTIAEQISAIRDPNVRFGRQFSITSESAGSSLADRTKWEYNVRKARSQVYSATVDGFRNQTGALWKINQIVNVDDEYAGIKSRMLINSVQFTLDADGRKTVLALVHKDSYTLTLASAVSIDKIGLGLIEPPVQNVVVLPDSIAPIWRPFNIRDIFEAE